MLFTKSLGDILPIVGIEHVQLAMPPGGENVARKFYSEVLSIPEIPKPPNLAKRGGVWFESGSVKIHLGIENEFRPARKAHPALLVVNLVELVEKLRFHNIDVIDGEPLDDYWRVYMSDPFGNRIELMERYSNI